MADVTNILHNNSELNNEQLLDYLQGNLSNEERNAIEQQMVEDEFTSDAADGLERVTNKTQLPNYVEQLNRQLQKNMAVKKQRKAKRKLKDNPWIVIAIGVILMICVLGYYVLHLKISS